MELPNYYKIILFITSTFISCSKVPVEIINNPPEILNLSANPNLIELNNSTMITCNAKDADNDELNYTWIAAVGKITGEGNTIKWNAPHPGDDFPLASYYPISCEVEDPDGLRDKESIEVTVSSHYLSFDRFNYNSVAAHFRVPQRMTLVITDNSVWYDLWDKYCWIWDGKGNRIPLSEFDFSEKIILGVFWGAGYSGGGSYLSSINSVSIANDTLYVKIKHFPRSGGFAEITPYDLVIIQKYDLPIEFCGKDYDLYFK